MKRHFVQITWARDLRVWGPLADSAVLHSIIHTDPAASTKQGKRRGRKRARYCKSIVELKQLRVGHPPDLAVSTAFLLPGSAAEHHPWLPWLLLQLHQSRPGFHHLSLKDNDGSRHEKMVK